MLENLQAKSETWREKALCWVSTIDGPRIAMLAGALLACVGLLMMVPGFARMLGWVFTLIGGIFAGAGILLDTDSTKKW